MRRKAVYVVGIVIICVAAMVGYWRGGFSTRPDTLLPVSTMQPSVLQASPNLPQPLPTPEAIKPITREEGRDMMAAYLLPVMKKDDKIESAPKNDRSVQGMLLYQIDLNYKSRFYLNSANGDLYLKSGTEDNEHFERLDIKAKDDSSYVGDWVGTDSSIVAYIDVCKEDLISGTIMQIYGLGRKLPSADFNIVLKEGKGSDTVRGSFGGKYKITVEVASDKLQVTCDQLERGEYSPGEGTRGLWKKQHITESYTGTINGNLPIHLTYEYTQTDEGKVVEGSYYYKKEDGSLELQGFIDNEGTVRFVEHDFYEITGIFNGKVNESGGIEGTWSNDPVRNTEVVRSYPFELTKIQ